MKQTHLLVGEIVRPQGIRGEVKLKHYTDDPYRFELLEEILRKTPSGYETMTIENSRVQGDDVFLKLEGIDDRNAAEALRGSMLYVDRDNALELEDNQFFIADFLGAKAVDTKGNMIGTLKEVLTPGGTDVFVFKTPRGEMMIPAIQAVILNMDADKGEIVLNESKLDEVAVYEDSHSDYIPRDV